MDDTYAYGVAVDDDPENPNPHSWALTAVFDTEDDAHKAISLAQDMGSDDRGWLVVRINGRFTLNAPA